MPKRNPSERDGHKALSFQEPWATLIATGVKANEYRSRRINTPVKDLVVCASKTASQFYPIPGLVYGKAIGLVDIVDCEEDGDDWVWHLANPRMIKPFDVHASASFFYVEDEPVVIPTNEDAYREHVLPHARKGTDDEVEFFTAAMFGDEEALETLIGPEDMDWL